MAHFIEQFGPACNGPGPIYMDVPELTDELVQNDRQSQSDKYNQGAHTTASLNAIRSTYNLVSMMRST